MDMSQCESNNISNILSYGCKILLRQEANTVGLTLHLVDEQQLTRYQRQTYRKAQGRLTTLWDCYEEKTLHTSEFLREVGNLFAHQYLVLQPPPTLTRTKLI